MSEPRLTTKLLSTEPARLEIDEAEIKVASGPDRGMKVRLSTDSLLIGSAEDCDLVLHDPTVSSRHAEIRVTAQGYMIRDLGSKNGLHLAKVAIDRAYLSDDMRVRVGDTVLLVQALGTRKSIPLAGPGEPGGMVAHSLRMRAVAALLADLAQSDVTVLIEGETGTGKEVAGLALHQLSPRRTGPFVVFDCGAFSQHLIAAELFGHEKGAFTGADQTRAGLLEEAEGGTLFLDEVGELPLEVQPLLLGVLERKSSRSVGGRTERRHDVRIIAATNRNLTEQVRLKRFRDDLFFRLTARVRIPPLRERLEDIPVLANAFAREAGVTLSPEMLGLFLSHQWPGNVRELRNTVQRAALPNAGVLDAAPIGDSILEADGKPRPLPDARRLASDDFERRYLAIVLARTGGNLTHAADLAGIALRGMQRLAAKHGIRGQG